jgi:hypothetical protein
MKIGSLGGRTRRVERFPGQATQRYRAPLNREFPGANARHVEQVVHNPRLLFRVAQGNVERLALHRGIVGVRAPDLEPPDHRSKRSAQFVRQRGEEEVVASLRVLERGILGF